MDSVTIDLNRAERATSFLTNNEQERYKPKTLPDRNNGRYAYLPIFPTKSAGVNEYLLLANIPVTHLAPNEIARRQQGSHTCDALILMNMYNYGDTFSLSEQDVEELAIRLNVEKSIITFNADRLRVICYTLLAFHESFRRNVLCMADVALKEPALMSKQMAILLEFYLQIDVDLFYMKTCSYRGAIPHSTTEGLFCGKDEPQARYCVVPCGNLFCLCCYPKNSYKKNESWPVIDFVSSSMHQFVNGYTTYLNCPATCTTTNIVYAMTCPCGHYDYVDSTTETLSHAMAYHREHGNRIVHETLTGSRLFRGSLFDNDEEEKELANKMRLYQHSARCPIALRTFLDCNPNYWCFVPLHCDEALSENAAYFQKNPIGDPELVYRTEMTSAANHRVDHYLQHVPLEPNGYVFSYRQVQKQRLFFQHFVCSAIQHLPYHAIDLYKMAIIAVLPDDRSILLRYMIETLFIIHGETKLNMICPIGSDVMQRYGHPYHVVWCANLNRLPMVTSTFIE
ncbi:unnamed protein product [Rotaria sp. Silwood1]|nr:unnamed protein product [Rotaria sp. Silwood1]